MGPSRVERFMCFVSRLPIRPGTKVDCRFVANECIKDCCQIGRPNVLESTIASRYERCPLMRLIGARVLIGQRLRAHDRLSSFRPYRLHVAPPTSLHSGPCLLADSLQEYAT
jgi:hypothetical protein